MSKTTITITHCADEYVLTADFAQASSPIMVDGRPSPFQVADASHRPARAAKLVADWLCLDDEYEWTDDED